MPGGILPDKKGIACSSLKSKNDAYQNYKTGYIQMRAFIAEEYRWTGSKGINYYLVKESLLLRMKSDSPFREQYFCSILKKPVRTAIGSILMRGGWQYFYTVYDRTRTKSRMKTDGNYIAVTWFRRNVIIGFQEAVLTKKGVRMLSKGLHPKDIQDEGFIKFTVIFLSYILANVPVTLLGLEENKTKDPIYWVL